MPRTTRDDRGIAAPTLIIAGKEDAREVATLLRHSSLMTVPEAGHALLMEEPDKASMAIRDFIDQHNH